MLVAGVSAATEGLACPLLEVDEPVVSLDANDSLGPELADHRVGGLEFDLERAVEYRNYRSHSQGSFARWYYCDTCLPICMDRQVTMQKESLCEECFNPRRRPRSAPKLCDTGMYDHRQRMVRALTRREVKGCVSLVSTETQSLIFLRRADPVILQQLSNSFVPRPMNSSSSENEYVDDCR